MNNYSDQIKDIIRDAIKTGSTKTKADILHIINVTDEENIIQKIKEYLGV